MGAGAKHCLNQLSPPQYHRSLMLFMNCEGCYHQLGLIHYNQGRVGEGDLKSQIKQVSLV